MNDQSYEERMGKCLVTIKNLPEPQRKRLMKLYEDTRKQHEMIAETMKRLRLGKTSARLRTAESNAPATKPIWTARVRPATCPLERSQKLSS